jgi:hypothetical protein
MGSRHIPLEEQGRILSGPTAGIAVICVSLSAVVCVGLSLSAALHIFGGFAWAPMLQETGFGTSQTGGAASTSSFRLTAWNVMMPIFLLAITLLTFRSWRKRSSAEDQ